jgi:hypothetical protein
MKTPMILPPKGVAIRAEFEIALLIGGPNDGERFEVRQGIPILSVPERLGLDSLFTADAPRETTGRIINYIRSDFSMTNGEKMGRFALFLWEPLTKDAMIAIQHLVLGYRNNDPIDAGGIMEAMRTLPDIKRYPWE